ncbi:MAG: hypothetical protein GY799_29615 [Desulfobulbaceae bacterium]|nr:hypothetical protein [Desulfobulbaceae bacterium]
MSDEKDTTESNQKYYALNEGMPTKPDVDLLLKTWPDPQIGDKFEYLSVEDLIGVNRQSNSNRFRSITNSWRKRLLEKGVVVECVANEYFYVASADQVSSATYGTLQSIGKKARKHRRKLSVIKTDTDEQRNIITHQGRLLHEVERQAKNSRTNILPDTANKEMPRAIPVLED